jgi:hypothetical protein
MPDPNVGDLLLAKIDELVAKAASTLEEVRAVTEQLHPERARSCRNAITMATVMVTRSACGPTPNCSTNPNPTETHWSHFCRPSAYGRRAVRHSGRVEGRGTDAGDLVAEHLRPRLATVGRADCHHHLERPRQQALR